MSQIAMSYRQTARKILSFRVSDSWSSGKQAKGERRARTNLSKDLRDFGTGDKVSLLADDVLLGRVVTERRVAQAEVHVPRDGHRSGSLFKRAPQRLRPQSARRVLPDRARGDGGSSHIDGLAQDRVERHGILVHDRTGRVDVERRGGRGPQPAECQRERPAPRDRPSAGREVRSERHAELPRVMRVAEGGGGFLRRLSFVSISRAVSRVRTLAPNHIFTPPPDPPPVRPTPSATVNMVSLATLPAPTRSL